MVFGSQEFFSGRLPVQEKCKNFSFDFNPLEEFFPQNLLHVLFPEVCMVRFNLEKLA